MKYFLGIDTSNYTTSMAVVDENNEVVIDLRKILEVKQGERGLRQSEAFFQHCNNIPEQFSLLKENVDIKRIVRVAVSTKPRNIEGSYMPVFRAGLNYANIIKDTLDIPLIECSHQEGHIYSGMVPINIEPPFLAIHLSGGTTDLLHVKSQGGYRLDIKTFSSSSDIHCGQFVDRLGVHMGLSFPAGKGLEKLAMNATSNELVIPSSVANGVPSFSGPLTKATRFYDNGESSENVALAAFKCISKTVEKMISFGMEATGEKKIMLVGGVASNSFVREYLKNKLKGQILFAPVNLAPDNAVGVACMGKKELSQNS